MIGILAIAVIALTFTVTLVWIDIDRSLQRRRCVDLDVIANDRYLCKSIAKALEIDNDAGDAAEYVQFAVREYSSNERSKP